MVGVILLLLGAPRVSAITGNAMKASSLMPPEHRVTTTTTTTNTLTAPASTQPTPHALKQNLQSPVPKLLVPRCPDQSGPAAGFTTMGVAPQPALQRSVATVCASKSGFEFNINARHGGAYSTFTKCNTNVWEESALEVMLAPVPNPSDAPEWYYEIDTSSAGALYVGRVLVPKRPWSADPEVPRANFSNCDGACVKERLGSNGRCTGQATFTELPDLHSAVRVQPPKAVNETDTNKAAFFTWTLKVPFSLFRDLRDGSAPPSTYWRANFYARGFPLGFDKQKIEVSMWSPTYETKAPAHVPIRFGILQLV